MKGAIKTKADLVTKIVSIAMILLGGITFYEFFTQYGELNEFIEALKLFGGNADVEQLISSMEFYLYGLAVVAALQIVAGFIGLIKGSDTAKVNLCVVSGAVSLASYLFINIVYPIYMLSQSSTNNATLNFESGDIINTALGVGLPIILIVSVKINDKIIQKEIEIELLREKQRLEYGQPQQTDKYTWKN